MAPHVAAASGRRVLLGACLEDSPDGFDERPFVRATAPAHLPPGIDLRRWMTPVESQGDLGGCSASALASAAEYLVLRVTGNAVDVSRMFLYFNQRLWRNRVREDCGGSVQDGVRVLARIGVPDERLWPYHLDRFAVQPPVEVYRAATTFRIDDWAKVPADLESMRACLAGGFPIALPVRLFDSVRRVGADGGVALPSAGEPEQGLHAVLVVGYVDAERLFIVRNSWGPEWGEGGYGYFPYDYLTSPAWALPGWALRGATSVRFDLAEHVRPDLARLPKAPPITPIAPSVDGASLLGTLGQLRGGASPWQLAVGLATQHSSRLVSAYTGNAALGEVVGGLVGGYAPGLVEKVRGVDGGVLSGPDLSETILHALRTPSGTAPSGERLPWADGYDDEAVVQRSGFVPPPAAALAASVSPPSPEAPTSGAVPQLFGGAPPTGEGPSAPVFGAVPALFAGAAALAVPSVAPAPSPAVAAGPSPPSAPVAPRSAPSPGPVTPRTVVDSRTQQLAAFSGEPVAGDPLRARWEALGGARSSLGRAADAPVVLADGEGRWLACEHGAVVFHPVHGPWEVAGAIFVAWSRMGSHLGPMGYPVAAEASASRGERGVRVARFERGVIVDWEGPPHDDLPPFALLAGDVLVDEWVRAGAEGSGCGLPLGVPRSSGDGSFRWLPCERGGVVWDPLRGAQVVTGPDAERWVRERLAAEQHGA